MAPLTKELKLFGKLTKHPRVWKRGLKLMQPFVEIRDRGAFPTGARVEDALISAALAPLASATGQEFCRIQTGGLREWVPQNLLFDLTDALRASPLQEDIPPRHLFDGMGLILGSLFLQSEPWSDDPKKRTPKNFGTALASKLSAASAVSPAWKTTLEHNYGGLWVHLLWHAWMGRDDKVTALEPLCKLMSLVPVVGFPGSTMQWFILCA